MSILSLILQTIVVRTSTRVHAANTTITTFILFTSIRCNTIAFTSTFSTTIMITVLLTTISITVAVTITLTSIIVLVHIVLSSSSVAVIVTFIIYCTMNATIYYC